MRWFICEACNVLVSNRKIVWNIYLFGMPIQKTFTNKHDFWGAGFEPGLNVAVLLTLPKPGLLFALLLFMLYRCCFVWWFWFFGGCVSCILAVLAVVNHPSHAPYQPATKSELRSNRLVNKIIFWISNNPIQYFIVWFSVHTWFHWQVKTGVLHGPAKTKFPTCDVSKLSTRTALRYWNNINQFCVVVKFLNDKTGRIILFHEQLWMVLISMFFGLVCMRTNIVTTKLVLDSEENISFSFVFVVMFPNSANCRRFCD